MTTQRPLAAMTDPLVALALIVGLGVGCQWLAARLAVPSILLLLGAGILGGPVPPGYQPDLLMGELLFPAVSLGVGILLFEGGLALRRSELSQVGPALARLVTIGTAVTWLVATTTVALLFDVGAETAALIGAILVVSGPTVVMPLLRLVNVRPTSASVLKWEGILIDPIGVLLAVVVLESALGANDAEAIFVRILLTLGGGAAVGLGVAFAVTVALRRHWVPDRLHNPVVLMAVIVAFVIANEVQSEAGLAATTIMGIAMANQRRAPVGHIVGFQEDLGVLVLGALFVLLGARVDLDDMVEFLPRALLLLAVLVLLARPLAVWLSTIGTSLPRQDRLFIASMAPRGIVAAAVASLFALELEDHGEPVAELVPVVFTVIIGSVVIYSIGARLMARRLQVAKAETSGVALIGGSPWVLDLAERLNSLAVPVLVVTQVEKHIADAVDRELLIYSGRLESDDLSIAVEAVGIATVLALSENDDHNDLAVLRFTHIVGRASVFALPHARDSETSAATNRSAVGRQPFGMAITRETIEAALDTGSVIQSYSHQPDGNDLWLPLIVVEPNGSARIAEDDELVDPGETVVGFVSPRY